MIRQTLTALAVTLSLGLISQPATSDEQRLISTDAGATELIFSLGLAHSLVAIDVTSQLPKGHKDLPNIGYHRNLSAEGLLSLEPTAVIGSKFMGPAHVVGALQQARVKLVRLPGAKTSEQLRSNILKLASALNQRKRGQQLLQQVSEQLVQLKSQSLVDQKIAFLLSMDTAKLRLAGNGSSGVSLIQLLGGSSVADFNNYQTVSAESLMAMQPDIILVAGKNPATAVDELLNANPILLHSPAGINSQIISVNGSTLVAGLSVSAVEEALRLATLINNQTAAH